MKRALLLLLLGLAAAIATPAQTYYVGSSGKVTSSTTSCAATVAGVAAGDTVIVAVHVHDGTAVNGVKDQLGNQVPLTLGPTTASSGFVERLYWYTAPQAGTFTFTSSLVAAVYNECVAYDYTLLTGLDVAALKASTAASASATSNAVQTLQPNDVLFAYFHADGSVTNTAGAGWAPRPTATNPNAEDQLSTTAGSYTAPMTFTAAANYVAFLVAFKAGSAASTHSVSLGWTQSPASGGTCPNGSVPLITGNNVYRSTSSGAETKYATLSAVTAYTDTALAQLTTYFYKVTAVDCFGESGLSAEVSAQIPSNSAVPVAPTGLQAVPR